MVSGLVDELQQNVCHARLQQLPFVAGLFIVFQDNASKGVSQADPPRPNCPPRRCCSVAKKWSGAPTTGPEEHGES